MLGTTSTSASVTSATCARKAVASWCSTAHSRPHLKEQCSHRAVSCPTCEAAVPQCNLEAHLRDNTIDHLNVVARHNHALWRQVANMHDEMGLLRRDTTFPTESFPYRSVWLATIDQRYRFALYEVQHQQIDNTSTLAPHAHHNAVKVSSNLSPTLVPLPCVMARTKNVGPGRPTSAPMPRAAQQKATRRTAQASSISLSATSTAGKRQRKPSAKAAEAQAEDEEEEEEEREEEEPEAPAEEEEEEEKEEVKEEEEETDESAPRPARSKRVRAKKRKAAPPEEEEEEEEGGWTS